jgi:3'-phosphoadenosine 5'-phosphosulfate sulfotransferase (PAPS reductase)/FAD synthetase
VSSDRLWDNPTTDLEAEAEEIVAKAKEEHKPSRTIVLFSGGNDSLVLLDAMAKHADEVAHINTGIGIPDTTDFARKVGASYGLPYSEWSPPKGYEELVLTEKVLDGVPGPGIHHIIFQRLKERCVREMLRTYQQKRGERFLLLTGVRKAESKRRMGYDEPVDRNGREVWVNPLFWWGNDEMHRYREERELLINPVSANLHMSGECLCGAMADQGADREERAMIRFFYPAFDARLSSIEAECHKARKTYCEWGVKRPNAGKDEAERMCQSCAYRLFDPDELG